MKKIRLRTMTLLIPPLVWLGWYFLPQQSPLPVLLEHWRIALTMAFGSFIGGATSEAGGAVAFPVFTKILAIPPKHAKLFSLATQSIGMGSAFLTILLLRIRVEWRAIFWVVPGSIPMLYVGLNLAWALPASAVRILFTVVQCSFALALYLHNRNPAQSRHDCLPRCEIRERSILLVFGMAGGLISGLLGSGLEIIVFSVLVLLFRLCEKTATPTVIVMMVLTTWAGFAMIVSRGEFVAPVTEYWLAAIPIVVVGGPLGVYACSHMPRIIIVRVLIGLILAELISSLLLIPLDRATAVGALTLFLVFSGIYYRMSLSRRYR
ncbi:sulfite exporter TauE/SafE family protein [Candidatus Methylospira mobilis]|uniref:sulfite exporter TauE/SafE family protein n=1 Tax=Candidatus Methylospira mobilis TaxID=1808979 RepID=UPI0028E39D35|nr:sulfite exporter TauE/SafE family protein [Candidatus Methylospira mobilis]WNV04015.1 sulfite exporter TauE/SafE family protein [Candidatus Methylospira mobilis]